MGSRRAGVESGPMAGLATPAIVSTAPSHIGSIAFSMDFNWALLLREALSG